MTWHLNKWGIWTILLRLISFHVDIPFIYLGCWPRKEYCFYFINSRQKARELCLHFQLLVQFESLWGFPDSVPNPFRKFVILKAFEIEFERGRGLFMTRLLGDDKIQFYFVESTSWRHFGKSSENIRLTFWGKFTGLLSESVNSMHFGEWFPSQVYVRMRIFI